MVRHQTVSDETDIDSFAGFAKELYEGCEVVVLAEDGAATVTAIEDVVAVTAQSVACAAWHRGIMGEERANVKSKVPCPLFRGCTTWFAAGVDDS
jgi:hypothetical protein